MLQIHDVWASANVHSGLCSCTRVLKLRGGLEQPSPLPLPQVSQLHVHITGRLTTDPAWPGPCYGAKPAVPMKPEKLASMADSLRKELNIQQ